MSYAYMALFTGDYLRDTRHLSCSEHGIYLLLLMHCWDTRGPVSLDERKQCGVCGARSGDEIEAVRRVLAEFFVRCEDGWYNPRMQRELEKMQGLSQVRSELGRKGGLAKAKQLPARAKRLLSTPSPSPSPSPSLSSTPESEALASSPSGISADTVLTIPLNDGTEHPVSKEYLAELEKLYPDVDPLQTIREVRGWSLANPTKRKTKAGILRHINTWFARVQNA